MASQSHINQRQRVIIPASGVARGPDWIVPDGATVYVRAHNGTDVGNAKPVSLGESDAEAKDVSFNETLSPNTQVPWPCENLNQIHVAGTKDDGIQIQIVR